MDTPRLLDELVAMGLDDTAFRRLHPVGQDAGIKAHRDYCATTAEFRRDGSNALLERRLLYVLHRARADQVAGRSPDFVALADAAKEAVLPAL